MERQSAVFISRAFLWIEMATDLHYFHAVAAYGPAGTIYDMGQPAGLFGHCTGHGCGDETTNHAFAVEEAL